MRDLLLYHWHCILPVIAIVAAILFMRNSGAECKEERKNDNHESGRR